MSQQKMSFNDVNDMWKVACYKCGSMKTCGLYIVPEDAKHLVLNAEIEANNGFGNWKAMPDEVGFYDNYIFFCIDCKTIQNDLSTMNERNKDSRYWKEDDSDCETEEMKETEQKTV